VATVRRRAIVSGRVQGVWFRESCRREAARLRVAGWVRNRGDGQVEVLAEGDPTSVQALLDWCHSGPPRARVTRVEVDEEDPVGMVGFRITG
jgi:acylphosphatase